MTVAVRPGAIIDIGFAVITAKPGRTGTSITVHTIITGATVLAGVGSAVVGANTAYLEAAEVEDVLAHPAIAEVNLVRLRRQRQRG